jgi:anti-anti-sigma regulatory factor
MLRITVVDLSDSIVVLRVEGRITGCRVEELRRTCTAHAFADEVQLSLELSKVSFTDAGGIALLKELRSRLADLIRPTPFVANSSRIGHHSTQPKGTSHIHTVFR